MRETVLIEPKEVKFDPKEEKIEPVEPVVEAKPLPKKYRKRRLIHQCFGSLISLLMSRQPS